MIRKLPFEIKDKETKLPTGELGFAPLRNPIARAVIDIPGTSGEPLTVELLFDGSGRIKYPPRVRRDNPGGTFYQKDVQPRVVQFTENFITTQSLQERLVKMCGEPFGKGLIEELQRSLE